jgi:hypothetical protein
MGELVHPTTSNDCQDDIDRYGNWDGDEQTKIDLCLCFFSHDVVGDVCKYNELWISRYYSKENEKKEN